MARYAYTGTLTDIGLGALTVWMPEVAVRPKVSAFGPDGLVSDVRVPVPLVDGAFTMNLIPSGDLTPAAGGTPGVDYVIEVGRYELGDDLTKIWYGTEAWEFTAVAGGGNVGGMNGGSMLAVWLGPPWPAGAENPLTAPKGIYIDTTGDNPFGIVT